MKYQALLMPIAAALLLSGCTVKRDLAATGGSKADGTVTLSYERPALLNVEVDPSQGLIIAAQRCKAWGYASAEEFGGITRTCNFPSGSGCASWLISKQYQCTGTSQLSKQNKDISN